MPGQNVGVETEVIVFLSGIEQKNIPQSLFADKPFEVVHVSVDDAGRAALKHIETGNFIGAAIFMDLQQLADANRQGKTFATRGVL
jgi:hypothetical protein